MSSPPSTSSQSERNAEIWSTRVQRELLALTSGNEGEASKDESVGVLPAFVTVKEHKLNIADGTCIISFLMRISMNGKEDENEEPPEDAAVAVIMVTLDASLHKQQDGSVDTGSPAYPFNPPKALLSSGESFFPTGSSVKDGDYLGIDCDWTPSLHLSDAIINVGLKIKESVLQKEPFHPQQEPDKDPFDEVVKGARRLTNKFSRSIFALGLNEADMSSSKRGNKKRSTKKKKKVSPPGEVNIGDEINLLESPWVDAQGVYSCKAVRRPGFVEDAIKNAAVDEQAGAAGFQGAGAMFRQFTQSARSVLEESFIMITDTHIIEMRSSKLNLSTGTVTFAIPIGLMAKLKFRRQESISLFFKPSSDDPLIYMCPDSADAVHQIQSVLKRHGVRGKHTNAAAHRAINEALQLVQEIQTKELALRHDPTVERVNEIMDLYRQAAERFESAGDVRHEEVVTHMRKFLALPVTVSILDGSYKSSDYAKKAAAEKNATKTIPEGEVLERAESQLALEGEKGDGKADHIFEQSMNDILKEAQEDLQTFKMDTPVEKNKDANTTEPQIKADAHEEAEDAFADLDAMLTQAGKELEELMKS